MSHEMRQDMEAVTGGALGWFLLASQGSSDRITEARDAVINGKSKSLQKFQIILQLIALERNFF